jgi:uncharacterized Zn-finger protein
LNELIIIENTSSPLQDKEVSNIQVTKEAVNITKRKKREVNAEEVIICHDCNKTFSRKPDLKRHLEGTERHPGLKRYICGCSSGFARADALKVLNALTTFLTLIETPENV